MEIGQEGVGWDEVNSGILPELKELKVENPNLKIGVSIGGWSKSGDFSTVAANPQARENLVNQTITFIDYTGMDFVDIDWEYPGYVREADKVDNIYDEGTPDGSLDDIENYILLLEEFRDALDQLGQENDKYYELSVALPVSIDKLENYYAIEEVFEIVDYANLMTYDMYGAWNETTGHQAPLYTSDSDPLESDERSSIDDTVTYLIDEKGVDSSKIVIGSAFYTRGWQGVSSDENNGLFQPVEKIAQDADGSKTSGAINQLPAKSGDGGRLGGVWSYNAINELQQIYPDINEYWDDEAKAPYLYSEESNVFLHMIMFDQLLRKPIISKKII